MTNMRAGRKALPSGFRSLASSPIWVYRHFVSPALPRRCRYEPTCSRYALRAIDQYGILRGVVLATWRLLRCNPWSRGGFDPVEAQRMFGAGVCARHTR
jgi:putative membrane protein insertion efficiency factor